MTTVKEISSLPDNKILSINVNISPTARACLFKVMKVRDYLGKREIYVVTREGILKYMGHAQFAVMGGKKNVHYKVFKTSTQTAKYINTKLKSDDYLKGNIKY